MFSANKMLFCNMIMVNVVQTRLGWVSRRVEHSLCRVRTPSTLASFPLLAGTLDNLELITFSYDASWPSSLLLTPEVLAPYNSILRLLLSIAEAREILHCIDDAVVMHRRELEKERRVRGRARAEEEPGAVGESRARAAALCGQALHRLGVFRFAATGALNGLHAFVHSAASSASRASAQAPAAWESHVAGWGTSCDPLGTSASPRNQDLFSVRQKHRELMEGCYRECVARAGEIPWGRLRELKRAVGICKDLKGLEASAAGIGELCKWRPV